MFHDPNLKNRVTGKSAVNWLHNSSRFSRGLWIRVFELPSTPSATSILLKRQSRRLSILCGHIGRWTLFTDNKICDVIIRWVRVTVFCVKTERVFCREKYSYEYGSWFKKFILTQFSHLSFITVPNVYVSLLHFLDFYFPTLPDISHSSTSSDQMVLLLHLVDLFFKQHLR